MYTIPLDAYRDVFFLNNHGNVQEVSIFRQLAQAQQAALVDEFAMSHETFKEVNKRSDQPTVVTKYDPRNGTYRNHHYLPDLDVKVDVFVKKTDPSRFTPCAETAQLNRNVRRYSLARTSLPHAGYNSIFDLYMVFSDALRKLDSASLASEAKKNEAKYRKACIELEKADRKTYFEARHYPPTDFKKLVPVFFEDGKWFADYEAE